MSVEWNESMATGVDSIDNQHKELFRQVALLSAALEQGKNRFELSRIFDSFAKVAMRHFAEEEIFMEDRQCPVADANKKAHDDLLTKIDSFRERFSSPDAKQAMALNFYDLLSRWLVKHITEIDTQLRLCIDPSESKALANSC
jgi:hemerythrin